MRVLVMCGAGASSTFIVLRLRRQATALNWDATFSAASESELEALAADVDLIAVGHHLRSQIDTLRDRLPDPGPELVLLSERAVGDLTGAIAAEEIRSLRNRIPMKGAPMADNSTATQVLTVGSAHGLHARPAKLFVQQVAASGAKVTLAKGEGKPANAASILGVIALGIGHGDEVTLTVEGENAEQVSADLAAFLQADHDA